MKKFLSYIWTPILISLAIILLSVFSRFAAIPSPEEISRLIQEAISLAALPAIAILSIMEHIAGWNIYFPGAIVILTAMAGTAGDLPRAFSTYLTILFSGLIAQLANYWIGWVLRLRANNSESKVKNGESKLFWLVFFATYGYSHAAGISSLAAGQSGMRFRQFAKAMSLSVLVWFSFWGILMYQVGSFTGSEKALDLLFYLYLGILFISGIVSYLQDAGKIPRIDAGSLLKK